MQLAQSSFVAEQVEFSARRIFNLIAAELRAVEAEFERQAESNVEVIRYLGDYLRRSGGKRVRPALLILSTYAVGGAGHRHNTIRLAGVMEFLHTATLVHDDIIDNAETRRGQPSINARFGNQTAVLMGDWLYMTAFENSLRERSLLILEILTQVTRKMVEGELMQMALVGDAEISEAQYFDVLERKTAFLFSACCEIGSLLNRETSESAVNYSLWQSALRDYGKHLGTAFQLVDDLLDFTGDAENLGKQSGVDLLEGKLTLPLIYLLEEQPALRDAVQAIMRDGTYDAMPRRQLIEAATESGALARAEECAVKFAVSAQRKLDVLPDSDYTNALRSIPAYILERDR